MAVTVTDRRTILTEADSLTNWTTADTLVTDTFAEGTSCVATAINVATNQIYFTTGTTQDYSNTIVYVYTSVVATKGAWTDGVHGILLGDGTDQISWNMNGNDRRVFTHSDGPVDWSCFCIDGSVAKDYSGATEHVVVNGSLANLDLAAITQVGCHYVTLSKALGGGNNCYNDIIRYGNDGLRATAGGSGTEGTFLEIVIEDRNTGNLKGHGLIRELTSGVYGIQGPITFGDSGTSTTCYFEDTGVGLAYEDRYIDDDKYYFRVEGHASATNSFVLNGSTISSAGPEVTSRFNTGNIDVFTLVGDTFLNLGRSITFSSDDDSTGHSITNCTFDACGEINIGKVGTFTDSLIINTTALSGTSGSLHFTDGIMSANSSSISYTNYTDGVGLWIDAGVTGTISLDNHNFDHTGVDVYWAGVAGTLTINLINGTNASSTNTAGGTISLVSTTDFTLTNLQPDTEVRIYTSGTTADYKTIGEEIYGVESVTGSTTFQYGTDVVFSGYNCIVMIHSVQYENLRFIIDLLGSDTSIPIQQQFDRNYSNP